MKKRKGVALLFAIIFSVLFLVMAVLIVVVTLTNIRTETELRKGLRAFYGAEAGIFTVAGWVIHNSIWGIVPYEILNPCAGNPNPPMGCYRIERVERLVEPGLGYAEGCSSYWRGIPLLINSEAPPNNPTAEIEAIVNIPRVHAGYVTQQQ